MKEKTGKTKEEFLKDLNLLIEEVSLTFPDLNKQQVLQWIEEPRDFFCGNSALTYCVVDDISPIIEWLRERR